MRKLVSSFAIVTNVGVFSVLVLFIWLRWSSSIDSLRTKTQPLLRSQQGRRTGNQYFTEKHQGKHSSKLQQLCRKKTNKFMIFSKFRPGNGGKFAVDKFHSHQNFADGCNLPAGVKCAYTEDDSLYHSADALYIHTCFSSLEHRAYLGQIIITYNMGPENRPCSQDSAVQKLSSGDIKVSYSTSSTIPLLYVCLPRIKQPVLEALRVDPPSNRHGIAMFVSDCRASWRYKYLKELMKFTHIDSFGKCLHNTAMPQSRKDTMEDNHYDVKVDLLIKKRYKFLIAFENTITSEYITEKIWHGYLSQTIPIYYGAPEVYEQVPGNNTFIDAAKFEGPKELADYIKMVNEDDQLYREYFNFNIHSLEVLQSRYCNFEEESIACDMCKKAYQVKRNRCKV